MAKAGEMSGLAATTALSPTFFRFRTILHRRLSARLNLNSGGRKEKERGSSKERASTRGASISVECFISTDIPRTISRWRKSCSSRRLLLILILRQPIPLSPRLVITRWSTDLRNHPLTIAHKRSKPHKKPSRWIETMLGRTARWEEFGTSAVIMPRRFQNLNLRSLSTQAWPSRTTVSALRGVAQGRRAGRTQIIDRVSEID